MMSDAIVGKENASAKPMAPRIGASTTLSANSLLDQAPAGRDERESNRDLAAPRQPAREE